ncbi:Gfo/Idh/MocA family oxidoreductase [Opitutus sp. ER46]|uniref:Gfo/Idh/MocA family protein n=1 Tax=Opitutus sp. ER46 TaxID=2161864 RepID=UPI000D301ADC|nr:Gfo/Idh/MocA family oxidoreductase [Opitutus sp. ER46]PTX97900.1 gfo/Idh/MocA family oxidoreductase [Opitutus sp. ER46]
MSAFTSKSGESQRRRYAIVGLGSRHEIYQDAIEQPYADRAQLVGLCDSNVARVDLARERSKKNGAVVPLGYVAADFGRMLKETKPDVVIVTTADFMHHEYLVRAMEAGCDVITEKPMTIDAEKCRQIVDARRRTSRNCRVTFNYRYSPPRSQVKELLMAGEIGEILSVDFHWLLNTHHGADYFRRWHSHKQFSGGLFVHKATHHFDLINWWLGATPVSVMAMGKREFYTPATAKRMGLTGPHERCHTCPEKDRCGFYMDLAAFPHLKALYLDCEAHDGYYRDRCVWRPDIDIEDTMNALVNYDTGATLSYSLNAFNAWEGYTVSFNGTKGRLEHTIVESTYINGAETVQGGIAANGVKTRIIPLRGAGYDITPWTAEGDHGGGDRLMLQDIFAPDPSIDRYKRVADERAGAWSILVGIAANRSLQTGAKVNINDLVPGLERPDYPPMPSRTEPLPMPIRVK